MEEAGLEATFEAVLVTQGSLWQSDMFFAVALKPVDDTQKLVAQATEVDDVKWMPLEDYASKPFSATKALYNNLVQQCVAYANGTYTDMKELRSAHGDIQAQASQLTGRRIQADEDPKALLCAAVPQLETGNLDAEDGDIDVVRTGTWLTATAHVFTLALGSDVLGLPWAMSTMGWIAGPVLLSFLLWTSLYTSLLLVEAYRNPSRTGTRNSTFPIAVQNLLGTSASYFCAMFQYIFMIGEDIGYTITAGISLRAVKRSQCFHRHPAETAVSEATGHVICPASNNLFMLIFGGIQIVLSQIPNLHQTWLLSTISALASVCYALVCIGLSIGKTSERGHPTGSIMGTEASPAGKVWNVLNGLGSMAFAVQFGIMTLEVQDTIRAPPSEESQMRKSIFSSMFFISGLKLAIGCLGFSAFGQQVPVNILTKSGTVGFFNPDWLIDVANVCVVVRIMGSYQVYAQTFFAFLLWRTTYVCLITLIAMLIPFFNDVTGLIGAVGLWPLVVLLPVQMHIKQAGIPKWQPRWLALQFLSMACMIICVGAAVGSIAHIIVDCKDYTPFKTKNS
ncbi:hypothetical protein WJX82_008773 [Trebouxia sp. C0006]